MRIMKRNTSNAITKKNPSNARLTLETLTPAPGSTAKRKRIGRGASSTGRTCGRGRGGSGHRSGNSRRPAFEGGQMPLVRRVPKRGFSNKNFAKVFDIINVFQLQDKFKSGEKITADRLKEANLVSGKYSVKILGMGELKKKLKISGIITSTSAKQKIEKAGGCVA